MSVAEHVRRAVDQALAETKLVWFGIRGSDAGTLEVLHQFNRSYSITDAYEAHGHVEGVSLEQLMGVRIDLDSYDIDFDPDPRVADLRLNLLTDLRTPGVVATYRPSHFLSSIGFASFPTSNVLGLFNERQSAFEHKPWVETELRRLGIPTVEWSYVADEHRHILRDRIARGPLVLRPNRTSGGAGVLLVETESQLAGLPTEGSDHFIGVSNYLDGAIPLNVGGVVWADGSVTLHPGSVQLIGLPSCTTRRFGFCGNDFAAFGELDPLLIDEVDATTRRIGRWLASCSYVGAFGVDYLLEDEALLFSEVNPRLQGSTALSARLAEQIGQADIVLEHVAATLGLESTGGFSLLDWADEIAPATQVILHNLANDQVTIRGYPTDVPRDWTLELIPDQGIKVDPSGVLARIVVPRQVTRTGFDLDRQTGDIVTHVRGALIKR